MSRVLDRNERNLAIERTGDRLALLVLAYGLLGVVAWRSFADGQASWELLGLVVLAGAVGAAYRLRQRELSREALAMIGITLIVAFVVGLVLALGIAR